MGAGLRDAEEKDEGGGGAGAGKFILRTTAKRMSEHYSTIGKEVLAAASFMATNDVTATLTCLVERKQFLLAYGLAKSAGMEDFQGLGELEKEFEKGGGRGVEEEGKDGDEVEESKS